MMTSLYVTVSFFLLLAAGCRGYSVLLIPIPVKSHVMSLKVIGQALVKRGHQAHMLLDVSFKIPSDWLESGVQFHRCGNKSGIVLDIDGFNRGMTRHLMDHNLGMSYILQEVRTMNHALQNEMLVNNDELIAHLKSLNLSIAIVDSIPLIKYMYLVPHKLGIPWITYSDALDPWLVPMPWLPSFHTPILTEYTSSGENLLIRLFNVLTMVLQKILSLEVQIPDELLTQYQKYGPFDSQDDLIRKSWLFFLTDHPALDVMMPCPGNIIHVGGLTTEIVPPPTMLSKYETFLESQPSEGTVIISFGSLVSSFSRRYNELFARAFTRLPQYRFIWKTNGTDSDTILPSNVLISDWLPQNQLLSRKEVVLFITHGGNNGQFEALYHGVPMLTIPLLGDQHQNAQRTMKKGFGEMLNFKEMTSDELVGKIQQIIKDPTYKQNVMKYSQMFRSQPELASERATFWIEHVLRFGPSHLQPPGKNLYIFQYLLIDVVLFLQLTIIVAVYCSYFICKRSVRYLRMRAVRHARYSRKKD